MKRCRFNSNWVYHLGGGSPIECLLGNEQQKEITLIVIFLALDPVCFSRHAAPTAPAD